MRGTRWGGDQSDRPRRGRWSQAEVARLKEMYGLKPVEYIAKELNRPKASIQRMADSLFPKVEREGAWTEAEVERLKRFLGICEVETIARIFGRAVRDVEDHIAEFDRNQTDRPWTQEEIADLKRLHGTRTDKDIARVFQRPEASVVAKAAELCLAKDKAFVRKQAGKKSITRMPRWSPDEIAKLKAMYAEASNLDIAMALDRTVKSVVSKAHNLGLKKAPQRLIEMGRQNVSLRYNKEGSDGGSEPESNPE